MDEHSLIDRALRGDADACAALVRTHYPAVYQLLAHLTRDVHQAEDLCQETFAAAWMKLGSFAGGSAFATWLHRIAYRQFLDSTRGAARQGRAPLRGHDREPAESRDPLAGVVADEDARTLHNAIDRLDPTHRQMLVMHYLMGLSYRQIAEITEQPAGTVKWRTSAALVQLRTVLGGETGNEPQGRQTTSPPAARPAAAANPAGA